MNIITVPHREDIPAILLFWLPYSIPFPVPAVSFLRWRQLELYTDCIPSVALCFIHAIETLYYYKRQPFSILVGWFNYHKEAAGERSIRYASASRDSWILLHARDPLSMHNRSFNHVCFFCHISITCNVSLKDM